FCTLVDLRGSIWTKASSCSSKDFLTIMHKDLKIIPITGNTFFAYFSYKSFV
ncbi:hypothetical protein ACKWTF_007856, partial [Chironomus riparius]